MKDKDFDKAEDYICHLIDMAFAKNGIDDAMFQLEVAKIHAIITLARVIQQRPLK